MAGFRPIAALEMDEWQARAVSLGRQDAPEMSPGGVIALASSGLWTSEDLEDSRPEVYEVIYGAYLDAREQEQEKA